MKFHLVLVATLTLLVGCAASPSSTPEPDSALAPEPTSAPTRTAAATPEQPRSQARAILAEGERVFEVDHFKSPCVLEANQLCLRVREGDEETFDFLYSHIEGFEFEWGHRYELHVTVVPVEIPQRDTSSERYILEEVLSKEPVAPGTQFAFHTSSLPPGTTPFLRVDSDGGVLLDGQGFRCPQVEHCVRISALQEEGRRFTVTMEYDQESEAPLLVRSVDE